MIPYNTIFHAKNILIYIFLWSMDFCCFMIFRDGEKASCEKLLVNAPE